MAQNITVSSSQLVKEALREVREISATDLAGRHGDDDVVVVDIRDVRELWREGRIPGSFHAPRGMLEFWVDPASKYFREIFAQDKTYVLHCAGGYRSALAAQVLQRMGLDPVLNLAGGFSAWRDAGGPIETVTKK